MTFLQKVNHVLQTKLKKNGFLTKLFQNYGNAREDWPASRSAAAAAVASVVSDPVRPHRRQPTRLPRPWDSPGKNHWSGCHFLLQGMKVKSESEVAQACPTLSDPMDCSPPGSSVHGIFQARALEWGAIAFSEIFCYLL